MRLSSTMCKDFFRKKTSFSNSILVKSCKKVVPPSYKFINPMNASMKTIVIWMSYHPTIPIPSHHPSQSPSHHEICRVISNRGDAAGRLRWRLDLPAMRRAATGDGAAAAARRWEWRPGYGWKLRTGWNIVGDQIDLNEDWWMIS